MGIWGVFLLYVLKDMWSWIKGSTRKHIEAIQENTMAMKELQIHLGYLQESMRQVTSRVEKVEKDVNIAHARIRESKETQV